MKKKHLWILFLFILITIIFVLTSFGFCWGLNTKKYNLFQIIVSLVQASVVIFAAGAYFLSLRGEKKEAKLALVESNSLLWVEYLKACREHPELDVFYNQDKNPLPSLDNAQRKIEKVIFAQLFHAIQREYTLGQVYDEYKNEFENEDWQIVLKNYFTRKNCQDAWVNSRELYTKEFAAYIDKFIQANNLLQVEQQKS